MARTYTKVNWQDGTVLQQAKVTIDGTDYEVTPAVESGTTPVNSTNLDKMDTAISNAVTDINNLEIDKIEQSAIELLEVTDTAPEHCSEGDMYYNTTTNYIYTATGTDTWGTTGELPSSDYLYIDLANQQLYYYDGTNFTSYGGGGGSTEVYIQDTEPTEEDWKIWIDSDKQTDNTYYNDNGTPTNIKTTTYDTLPVGTEVDYDGDTAPTGWTEVDEIETLWTGSVTGTNEITLSNSYKNYKKLRFWLYEKHNYLEIDTELLAESDSQSANHKVTGPVVSFMGSTNVNMVALRIYQVSDTRIVINQLPLITINGSSVSVTANGINIVEIQGVKI